MIKCSDIHYIYTDFQTRKTGGLKNISFEIKKKERVVMLGINGSGKSTLLKVLNGLIYPQQGSFFYNGKEITKASLKQKDFNRDFRKEVVFLFQSPDTMLFNPTVYDEIAFGLNQLKFSDIDERVHYWAERLGIEKYLDTPPFNLSGGEKQKICLASLLALEPEVLLLDEPMANLDPKTTGWLVEFLFDLNLTTLITTHTLSLARDLGDRAMVLSEKHELFYDGDLDTLLNDQDRLIKANLVHIHKHHHKDVEHSYFHQHDWR